MAKRMGLEPTTSGVTGRRSNQLNYRSKYGVGEKTRLNKVAKRMGLEPTTSGVTGRRSNQLNYRSTFRMVGSTGLEPVTPAV